MGAFVYSETDLSSLVSEQLSSVGLTPGVDEFKSGTLMKKNPIYQDVRSRLFGLFHNTRLALVVVPSNLRAGLGDEALVDLEKVLRANDLLDRHHEVVFDEGIQFKNRTALINQLELDQHCAIHCEKDSRVVGGLQLADLAAHTLSVMLLEQLGMVDKLVKSGEDIGFVQVSLGWKLWATIRYYFFTQDQVDFTKNQLEGWTLDTGSYALHVSICCDSALQQAAEDRFGRCYMGCVH